MIKKNTETMIEDLAIMVKNGFDSVDKRFDNVDGRFDLVDKRFEHVDGRLGKVEMELSHMSAQLSTLEHDVSEISRNIVSRNEFEDLMGRVKYLEIKLGVKSGK